jgi:hypothetical protein
MNTGNQNDQAAQPSASNQNNQLVQLSADKNKKRKKREADKKFRDRKKVWHVYVSIFLYNYLRPISIFHEEIITDHCFCFKKYKKANI